MARCQKCGKTGLGLLEVKGGACPRCRREEDALLRSKSKDELVQKAEDAQAKNEAVARVQLTTETSIGDVERLGIVAAEVVFGMNIFKDVLANVRDIFGGRSGTVQKTLEKARQVAFDEMRLKAFELGADFVIAVDVNYHSISTGPAVNMMIVGVTGTAVKRKSEV